MIFSKMPLPIVLRILKIAVLALVSVVVVTASPRLGAQDLGATDPGAKDLGAEYKDRSVRNEIHLAQGYGRPPGDVGEPGDAPYAGEQLDGAQLLVRIGRLESQMRQINGQIEQMQFQTHKLEEQLKKFQEDVDFRFHEGAPGAPAAKTPQRRGDGAETQTSAEAQVAAPSPAMSSPAAPSTAAPPPRASGRGDAFDPSQNPAAQGAPRQLGSQASAASANPGGSRRDEITPSGLDQNDPGAPLDLSNGRSRTGAPPAATSPSAMAPSAVPASGITTPGGTVIAARPQSAKEEFDIALAYLKQRGYENAEKGFTGFLEKNPKSKMAPDAIYFLGESFYLRGRQREAAEQYLKLSTQYSDSPRAPEALLRLGQSLNALGAKEQACATYGEIGRKYPNAPSMVKVGAERESKRAQC
jgi:tol-pal system protein YbgF